MASAPTRIRCDNALPYHGPGAYDAGWKDTIDLRAAEQARIAVRFNDYPGRFVFHCHNLEHEDMGMMATFVTS